MSMTNEQAKLLKRDKEMIPLVLIRAMFFLALMSVALVAYARLTDRPLVGVASMPDVAAQTQIILTENPDQRGSYIVTDLDGNLIITSADTKAGFIGVIGQALKRKRMLTKTPMNTPIDLIRRVDGRVDIIDAASGLSVPLMSYGGDNIAIFNSLIPGA